MPQPAASSPAAVASATPVQDASASPASTVEPGKSTPAPAETAPSTSPSPETSATPTPLVEASPGTTPVPDASATPTPLVEASPSATPAPEVSVSPIAAALPHFKSAAANDYIQAFEAYLKDFRLAYDDMMKKADLSRYSQIIAKAQEMQVKGEQVAQELDPDEQEAFAKYLDAKAEEISRVTSEKL
ncbi:MAG TPA: hypothetical protein VGD78_18065 [Chthoniobacterales bacterium]